MAGLGVLLFLAACSGVKSQIQLAQSGPEVRKPGESLKLTCRASGYAFASYAMNWVLQAPGKGLEYIGYINTETGETGYAEAFKGRFSIARDTSISTAYLQLNSLNMTDTAMYYCAREGPTGMDYWGPGTMVTVTSAASTAPSYFPLASCCSDQSSPEVLACLVSGYFPEPVIVKWDDGKITKNIQNFPSVLDSSSGLYTMTSQVTVSAGQTKPHKCTVIHEPTSFQGTKEVESCDVRVVPPEIELLHSSCSIRPGEQHIQLVCAVSGFSPSSISAEWLVDGKPGHVVYTDGDRHRDEDRTFRFESRANVTEEEWIEGKTYTCRVNHPASGTVVQAHARRCQGPDPHTSGIRVFLLVPSPASLYVSQVPKLTCLITNLPSDSGLTVTWSREKQGSVSPEPLELMEMFNGTYTATSSLVISTQDWESGEKFSCTVEHNDFPTSLSKHISKKEGKKKAPETYLLGPHPEELTSKTDFVSLTCLAHHFYPEDISIQWLKNHGAIPEKAYRTTPVMEEEGGDSSFFLYSKLTVDKDSWNSGDSYTCMVVHEALPMKFTQRSIQKTPGK